MKLVTLEDVDCGVTKAVAFMDRDNDVETGEVFPG